MAFTGIVFHLMWHFYNKLVNNVISDSCVVIYTFQVLLINKTLYHCSGDRTFVTYLGVWYKYKQTSCFEVLPALTNLTNVCPNPTLKADKQDYLLTLLIRNGFYMVDWKVPVCDQIEVSLQHQHKLLGISLFQH